MDQHTLDKCKKYQNHFSELLGVGCKVIDIASDGKGTLMPQDEADNFCRHCLIDSRDELASHMYGCCEAHRWNGKYIYYCPLGLTFIAASIANTGMLTGGLVLGPLVMNDVADVLYDLPVKEMAWAVSQVGVFSTRQVRHISEILSAVASQISDSLEKKPQKVSDYQEEIFKKINIYSENSASAPDEGANRILAFEKDLRLTVIAGEKAKALAMLNDMLAQIYVYSKSDILTIKARLLELLVVLSRASIEAGADTRDSFQMNEHFIAQIEQQNDVDQLAVFISDIARSFIVQVFDLAQVKHSDVVFKITNHIKQNCATKLTLDSLAKKVYLSKSYLSSVFKQETGMSLTSYITKVRIEKSKRLLLEENLSLSLIATQCGFNDQSYFTKTFKKVVGVSPKKFKKTYFK
ncbi:MAG: helix-turn-helix domain-containing protein [Oscillospiraceae bacterium]|jgi:YesN/AraC family two-component response regulator|nr:helix-turn-helix domain-containing protein [Oscillospiraceae bacterium]